MITPRDKPRTCLITREKAERKLPQSESRKYKPTENSPKKTDSYKNKYAENTSHKSANVSSAEVLVKMNGQNQWVHTFNKCLYCRNGHWSDEHPTFRTIEERKKKLKGSRFKCFEICHTSNTCKGNIMCIL